MDMMTQEQDIVERLLKCEKFFISDYGYNHAATCAEARQIIAALRAERDEWKRTANSPNSLQEWQERAEAAEARVKELKEEVNQVVGCTVYEHEA
jgi:hypothetical protein